MADMANVTSWTNHTNVTTEHNPATNPRSALPVVADFMSRDTAESLDFAMECVVFPVVTVFGVTGNVLSLLVLCQRKFMSTSSTVVLLIALTVADMLFLVAHMVRESKCLIRQVDAEFAQTFEAHTFSPIFYLKTSMSRISSWIVVIISLERFIAVRFPFKVKMLMSRKKMVFAVLFVYTFTLALFTLFIPQVLPKNIRGKYYIAPTEFYIRNQKFLSIFNNYIAVILFRWVPKVLIIIFNTFIYFLLRKRMKEQAGLTNSAESKITRDHLKLTRTLFVVAVVFIVCLLPGDAFVIAGEVEEKFSPFGDYRYSFSAFSNIAVLFEMVNSSVNFIIYILTYRKFAHIYKAIVCGCVGVNVTESLRYTSTSRSGVDSMAVKTEVTDVANEAPTFTLEDTDVAFDLKELAAEMSARTEIQGHI